MQRSTLGSAAATLALSLIYSLWPAASEMQPRPAPERPAVTPAVRPTRSPDTPLGHAVKAPVRPSDAPDNALQQLDVAVQCEIPIGRAALHWMEYLKLDRARDTPAYGEPAVHLDPAIKARPRPPN